MGESATTFVILRLPRASLERSAAQALSSPLHSFRITRVVLVAAAASGVMAMLLGNRPVATSLLLGAAYLYLRGWRG